MKVIKGNFSHQNKKQKNLPEKISSNTPVISDEEGNYSVMLIDLIKPYMADNPKADELEENVELGMVAWNLSISKSLGVPGSSEMLKSAVDEAGFDKKQVEIIKKMAKDKQMKFPGYNSFIESYKMKEDTDNRMKVVVACLPLRDMMEEAMDFDDDDLDDFDFDDDDFLESDQYEEGIVERSAFSINHKPAFEEWAQKTNSDIMPRGSTVYLIEEKDSEEEADVWLKKNYQHFMTDELAAVTEDKRKWPKLNYNIFREFFEVRYHEMVWDTEERPIKKY